MTVVIFNHFHAGDILMSRTVIQDIRKANRDRDVTFELQCKERYVHLWHDLGPRVTGLEPGQEAIGRGGAMINLHFATFGDMLSRGLTYRNHVETYNRQAEKHGLTLLEYTEGQRFMNLPRPELTQIRQPAVLIENGQVLSGQPVFEINHHLSKLAHDFPHVFFYCSGKVHHPERNLIDVSNWNLFRISVLSEHCKAIIARLSAIMVCSFTKNNYGRKRFVFGQPLGCPIWDEKGLVYLPNDYAALKAAIQGSIG